MIHFHLQYFAPGRPGIANVGTFFCSEMDALHAAGLANATRGKESGYYGVKECGRVQCERLRQQGDVLGSKVRKVSQRIRAPRAPGW